MSEWIKGTKPNDERIVQVKIPSGIYPAWWKGIGWKCADQQWINSDVVEGWREMPDDFVQPEAMQPETKSDAPTR